jgi:K+-transporting ATPase A subunit
MSCVASATTVGAYVNKNPTFPRLGNGHLLTRLRFGDVIFGGVGSGLVGRYWIIVAVLAIAGALAAKKKVPPRAGTLPTHTYVHRRANRHGRHRWRAELLLRSALRPVVEHLVMAVAH